MLALLDGPAVHDTVAGCVMNLVTGESWTAIRKQGASHDGKPLKVLPSRQSDRIQILGLETSARSLASVGPLLERSNKIRILGSMALSIAHTATGTFDAFCAPSPRRVFDMAASLLILAEAGGVATDTHGKPLGSLACTLETKTSLLCAPNQHLHAAALSLLGGGE
jgi:fructose-1,6-bisphosphatase/inositol monophosphatase family enzyme